MLDSGMVGRDRWRRWEGSRIGRVGFGAVVGGDGVGRVAGSGRGLLAERGFGSVAAELGIGGLVACLVLAVAAAAAEQTGLGRVVWGR